MPRPPNCLQVYCSMTGGRRRECGGCPSPPLPPPPPLAPVPSRPPSHNQPPYFPWQVASGVDAAAILAVAVVIDEDHDESDAKKERQKAEQSGGWSPFG